MHARVGVSGALRALLSGRGRRGRRGQSITSCYNPGSRLPWLPAIVRAAARVPVVTHQFGRKVNNFVCDILRWSRERVGGAGLAARDASDVTAGGGVWWPRHGAYLLHNSSGRGSCGGRADGAADTAR